MNGLLTKIVVSDQTTSGGAHLKTIAGNPSVSRFTIFLLPYKTSTNTNTNHNNIQLHRLTIRIH